MSSGFILHVQLRQVHQIDQQFLLSARQRLPGGDVLNRDAQFSPMRTICCRTHTLMMLEVLVESFIQ